VASFFPVSFLSADHGTRRSRAWRSRTRRIAVVAAGWLASAVWLGAEVEESASAAAEEVVVSFWFDEGKGVRPSDAVAAADAGKFTRLDAGAGGERRGPHWLKIDLPRGIGPRSEGVVEFANAYVDDLTVFERAGDRGGGPARAGHGVAMAERDVRSHLPAVRVSVGEDAATVVYVRSVGNIDAPEGVKVWASLEAFRRYELPQVLSLALYFGLWAALLVYNAFVYVVLRDRVVWWYVGYLAAMGGLALIATNFSAWLFTGPTGLKREMALLALLMAGGVALMQFTRGYLETAVGAPRVDRWLRGLAMANAMGVAASALVLRAEWFQPVGAGLYLLAVATLASAPMAGVGLWRRGNRLAPLFVLGFACFGGGLGWMIVAQFDYLPAGQTNGLPFLIGSALEMLLFSIAVAYRYRLIREKEERLKLSYTENLERDVATRTQELATANADKDRLISLVAHDVRSPLAALKMASQALAKQSAAPGGDAAVAESARSIRERCEGVLTLVDNVLEWGRLRTGNFTRDPAEINLAGMVEAAIEPLRGAAAAKQLRLANEVPEELTAIADGYAVQGVVRNLVSNAIKFTPSGGGAVVIAARRGAKAVELIVEDAGVGLTPEQRAKLERSETTGGAAGTDGESGVGIGLALCRELAEREGGALRFESPVGAGASLPGTRVIFTLPSAPP
jgi:signal transduction histidine kinase